MFFFCLSFCFRYPFTFVDVEVSVVKPHHFRLRLSTGAFAAAAMPKGDILFQLHGAHGISDTISFRSLLAGKGTDPFRAGATDVVEFKTRMDIGAMKKLTLIRDVSSDSGGSHGFFVATAEIEDLETKSTVFFLINSWLKSPILQLDAPAFLGEYNSREPEIVEVTVRTGRSMGAGTNAPIWIQWYTPSGLTSGQLLLSSSCSLEPTKDPFERSQIDKFRISLPVKIWPPAKLVVTQGFDTFLSDWELSWASLRLLPPAKDSEKGKAAATAAAAADAAAASAKDSGRPASILSPRAQAAADDKARTAKEEAAEALFMANAWLKKATPRLQLDRSTLFERYSITVVTADEKNAGTNSNVFMKMIGQSEQETEEFQLKESETHVDKFERGNSDVFEYFARAGLGRLSKVAIRSDCSSFLGDAWKLDKVTCTHLNSSTTTEFICREWIDKKNPAVLLSAFSSSSESIGSGANGLSSTLTHELHVLLGNNVQVPSTTSTVLLSLVCSKGRINEIKLLDPQPVALSADMSFSRRGVQYSFTSASALGDVLEMELRIIPNGDQPVFFPQFLVVKTTGGGGKKKGTAAVETLFYNTEPLQKMKPSVRLLPHTGLFMPYEVSITTGDRPSAGTRGSVSVSLTGEKGGSSGVIQLLKARERDRDFFQKAQTDTFQLVITDDLVDVTACTISHRVTVIGGNKWFCDSVAVKDVTRGKTVTFPCGQWLDSLTPDVKLTPAQTADLPSPGTPKASTDSVTVSYKVFVRTSDIVGAGTDANVWLTIKGQLRAEEKLQLKKSLTHLDKFERGQEDVFEFALAPLGALESVTIGHDNSTGLLNPTGAAWHLDAVEIVDGASGQRSSFPCKQWLAKDKGDEKCERLIMCSTPPPPLPPTVVSSVKQEGGKVAPARSEGNVQGTVLPSHGNSAAVHPTASTVSSESAQPRRQTMFPPRVGGMSVWDMCDTFACPNMNSEPNSLTPHALNSMIAALCHALFLMSLAATTMQTLDSICLSAQLFLILDYTRGRDIFYVLICCVEIVSHVSFTFRGTGLPRWLTCSSRAQVDMLINEPTIQKSETQITILRSSLLFYLK